MERLNDNAGLELLQSANACLADFFVRFSSTPVAGHDEELRALQQLQQALESVRPLLDGRLQNIPGDEVSHALQCYRQNLIRLRTQLSLMQQSAIAQRERLDCRQFHLANAKAWCAISRATV